MTFTMANDATTIIYGNKKYRLPVSVPYINEAEINTPIRDGIGDGYLPLIIDAKHTNNVVQPTANPAFSDSMQKTFRRAVPAIFPNDLIINIVLLSCVELFQQSTEIKQRNRKMINNVKTDWLLCLITNSIQNKSKKNWKIQSFCEQINPNDS